MKKNRLILILIFVLFSCQQIETLDKFTFNYELLPKLTIAAEQKNITSLYDPKFVDPYIDHSLLNSPEQMLNNWINNNISIFGLENNITINIIDASVKKSEIPNIDKKKYEDKIINLFEVMYLVEFILYDDYNNVIANSIVEAKSSITSRKRISLNENQKIIDELIYNCLYDFTNKSKELINIHMKNFIL